MVDIIILIVLIIGAIRGYFNGFIIQSVTLFALIAGLWAATKFNVYFAHYVIKLFGVKESISDYIAFAIIFVIVVILVGLLGMLLTKFIDKTALGTMNRIAGVLFGMFKVLLISSIIIFLIQKFDKKSIVLKTSLQNDSFLFEPVSKLAPTILPHIDFERVKSGILGT